MPIIQTAYGPVDQDGLEDLRGEFDTTALLRAVDAVDRARGQLEELRENLLEMHGVTMHLVNGDSMASPDSADVHELTEMLESGAYDVIEAMEAIHAITDQLEQTEREWELESRRYKEQLATSRQEEPEDDGRVVALENEIEQLRLQMEEKDRLIAREYQDKASFIGRYETMERQLYEL